MEWHVEIKDLSASTTNHHSLDKAIIKIGRNKNNDIAIDNKQVSRDHAVLEYENGYFFLEDLQSTNGTYLNLGDSWKKISHRIQISMPATIRIAKDILVLVSSKVLEPGESRTSIEDSANVPESHLHSIMSLERDEAIMVLDLCGSTTIASIDEKMAFHLKKRLEEITKEPRFANNINFYKNTGDGFLATFPSSMDAIKAAKEMIIALHRRNKHTKNPPIHIRISLHKGKTYLIDPQTKDIHGNDINVTFRIDGIQEDEFISLANKYPSMDRILCSKEFVHDIRKTSNSYKEDFVHCGTARLKNIEEPKEIFWIKCPVEETAP